MSFGARPCPAGSAAGDWNAPGWNAPGWNAPGWNAPGWNAPEENGLDEVRGSVAAYYAAKLARHGATARGVDWTCGATQALRFVQLMRLLGAPGRVRLNDIGCGYGALVDHLAQFHPVADVDYLGIDLSPGMICAARRRHAAGSGTTPRLVVGTTPRFVVGTTPRFVVGSASPRMAEYAVASGVMNVRLHHADAAWERFVAATLRDMRRRTLVGFAVNFLAPLAGGAGVAELYRTEPARWAGFCAGELGCAVEVLSGYGLREFTLLARHGAPQ